MPFVRLTLIPAPGQADAVAIAEGLTDLMAQRLNKRADLTAVLVETPTPSLWTIGRAPVEPAAHLEVTITAGTNNEAEKAAFIADAMALLRTAMPDLHAASYVTIRECPAMDWGYGGLTQAERARNRP